MPRTRRMINSEDKTAYHLMSRTALDGFPFGDVEKDVLVDIIKKNSRLFFVEVFGFCIMSNHFHLLVQTIPGDLIRDEDVVKRLKAHYGNDFMIRYRGMRCINPHVQKKKINLHITHRGWVRPIVILPETSLDSLEFESKVFEQFSGSRMAIDALLDAKMP